MKTIRYWNAPEEVLQLAGEYTNSVDEVQQGDYDYMSGCSDGYVNGYLQGLSYGLSNPIAASNLYYRFNTHRRNDNAKT